MIGTKYSARYKGRSQTGLTLIELLVSLAITLVIALVAAAAYLGTRSTATAISNISSLNETGKLALDMVGRELQMAGYYPAILSTNIVNTASLGAFSNTKNTAKVAYNQGLFGCDGSVFNPTTATCSATLANAPDSIVINYFATPELDTTTFASGFDCLRQAIANDPGNAGQLAINRPLYVSNRFGLSAATTYNSAGSSGLGRSVTTRSLTCNGNGKNPEDDVYQPIFEGIEDLVFRYGVHAGIGSLSPERYYTAAEVTALPTVADKTGWQRVTAVRVCALTRTLENSRTQDKAGSLRTYADCRGNVNTYAVTDRSLFKRFERVFAIRNNLNGTY
jgi:type IV pilus assembly protein PilW